MKFYVGKSYIDSDSVKEVINEVLRQIETLEVENERLEKENKELRQELEKYRLREHIARARINKGKDVGVGGY